MQQLAPQLKHQGKRYFVFPLEQLTGFESFGEVQRWVAAEWQISPSLGLTLFFEQSWALAHFLNEGAEGVRRDAFATILDLLTRREEPKRIFPKAYGLSAPPDPGWKRMNAEFKAHVKSKLMKLDPKSFAYEPPPVGHDYAK